MLTINIKEILNLKSEFIVLYNIFNKYTSGRSHSVKLLIISILLPI